MGLKLGITMLIHNKDDIQFVTEFLCFLGHPVFDHSFIFESTSFRDYDFSAIFLQNRHWKELLTRLNL